MNLINFDTYDFFKKLKDVGFSEKQAETLIDLQKVTLSVLKEELVKFKLERDGEILFLVRRTEDGGFIAESIHESICTQAKDMNNLYANICDAMACHFGSDNTPKFISLHFAYDEVITIDNEDYELV